MRREGIVWSLSEAVSNTRLVIGSSNSGCTSRELAATRPPSRTFLSSHGVAQVTNNTSVGRLTRTSSTVAAFSPPLSSSSSTRGALLYPSHPPARPCPPMHAPASRPFAVMGDNLGGCAQEQLGVGDKLGRWIRIVCITAESRRNNEEEGSSTVRVTAAVFFVGWLYH
uniref:Uncharacterized protein n=1 Tax=Oryza nivara TaxID=4536 RepID=A0A0E0HAN6_ORYNI